MTRTVPQSGSAASGKEAKEEGVESEAVHDKSKYREQLGKIRRRRWLLWFVIAIYLPLMWGAEQVTHSFEGALPVFGAWVAALLVVTFVSALVRCPRCGNYFHVNGMILLYLRRCLHCQLHINAGKEKS